MTWRRHIREALTELFLRMSLPDCSGNHELQALSQTVLLRTGKFNCMRHSFHYFHTLTTVSSVQFSRSVVSASLRPHGLQHARTPCSSPSPGVYLLMCIESVMPSDHLILCGPLLLPSIFPGIRVFSNESICPVNYF